MKESEEPDIKQIISSSTIYSIPYQGKKYIICILEESDGPNFDKLHALYALAETFGYPLKPLEFSGSMTTAVADEIIKLASALKTTNS